jgi:hypothetical protein
MFCLRKGGFAVDRVEEIVDELMEAYQSQRVRLWLANFADMRDADEFGQWGGLVRLAAEAHVKQWRPERDTLVERLRDRSPDTDEFGFDSALEELLPLAQSSFASELASRRVPRDVVQKASGLFSIHPPLQQWRMD